MMISREKYSAQGWRVLEHSGDFTLWDAWELPVGADNSAAQNFRTFEKIFWQNMDSLSKGSSITGFLMALRGLAGKIFPLDKNINTLPIPGCRETTFKARLKPSELKKSGKTGDFHSEYPGVIFTPVYMFNDESLYELSNDTVHALLHLGWVKKGNKSFTAVMGIYVKPRGILGKTYLKIIEPFRHFIVYPAMMKMIKAKWQEHVNETLRSKKRG